MVYNKKKSEKTVGIPAVFCVAQDFVITLTSHGIY